MGDLSVIYLTANKVPRSWAEYQRRVLKEATDATIISISREPLDFGDNLLDTDKQGYINIYRQILRGAKHAKTEYVAIAEDDVLYPEEHFKLRPKTILYNQNRFALFTWNPVYNWRNRKSNCSMIAKREYLIEALQERFDKLGDNWPEAFVGEVGRSRVERGLGVTPRESEEVYSEISLIQFNHTAATEDRQKRKRKSLGPIKAYDIPHWGKASELVKLWN